MTDAFGTVTWWGFSPALDLQDSDAIFALKKISLDNEHSNTDDLNVLLAGAGDIRHILKTMARSYRHRKRKINFYVIENSLELYARDILLLAIALENQQRMGLQEKAELFLELFGNTLIRQQSSDYVKKMSNKFINMVTDFDYLEKTLPIVDLSQLKFKERDFLEGIFKFWRNPDNKVFDINQYWDVRLRSHLKTRYDSRSNVFDWDYNMFLSERGGDIINKREYCKWRENGVGFEIREGTYDVPNKTLASGLIIKHDGEKLAKRGYWGDILVSPYISLGIECEERSFFKKNNRIYAKTATDISEFNIISFFHEILNKTKYILPAEEEAKEQKSATLTEITEDEENEEIMNHNDEKSVCNQHNEDSNTITTDDEYEQVQVENIQVVFLPLNSLEDLPKKSKYQQKFDIIYFSNSLVHLLKPDINPIFSNQASVIIETAKFMLELKDEQLKEFVKKVNGLAVNAGCKIEDECDGMKDAYAEYTYERKKS